MGSYNSTKDGVLTSKGFVSCWGMLLVNKTKGETWGFHINCPDTGFNELQKKKLAELGRDPGEKHAVLMFGDYCKEINLEETEKLLSGELKEIVPSVHLEVRKMTKNKSCPEEHPQWEIRYDAGTNIITVTEHPYPGCVGEGKSYAHAHLLFGDKALWAVAAGTRETSNIR